MKKYVLKENLLLSISQMRFSSMSDGKLAKYKLVGSVMRCFANCTSFEKNLVLKNNNFLEK